MWVRDHDCLQQQCVTLLTLPVWLGKILSAPWRLSVGPAPATPAFYGANFYGANFYGGLLVEVRSLGKGRALVQSALSGCSLLGRDAREGGHDGPG